MRFSPQTNASHWLHEFHEIFLSTLDCGYRVDFLVAGEIVVEVKAVDALIPIHEAQVLTYLKLGGCKVGLLIDFHAPLLKRGIKRLVLGLEEK